MEECDGQCRDIGPMLEQAKRNDWILSESCFVEEKASCNHDPKDDETDHFY